MPPTSVNRYILEIDGVPAVAATEATPPGFKQTPGKYQPGNQPNPTHFRGNFEIEEMTFKHARGIGQAGRELVRWLIDYSRGLAVQKRSLRFITMDETGRSPLETWECLDCVPTMYKPEQGTGTGTDVATFTFSLQPDDARLI
jgi:hypothetical protein